MAWELNKYWLFDIGHYFVQNFYSHILHVWDLQSQSIIASFVIASYEVLRVYIFLQHIVTCAKPLALVTVASPSIYVGILCRARRLNN